MRHLHLEAALDAICAQTRSFVQDRGFSDVVIGLSGGMDSSVVTAIACTALGPDHVHGVLMPSPFTSRASIEDAEELACRLEVATASFPITDPFAALSRVFEEGSGEPLSGLAAENTQARLRMCILMALSNARGWMVLNTGNLSEAAMGYSTLYGDTAGAFAPIGGLYKTEVAALARLINERALASGSSAPIPQNVLEKPPSAELSEGQTDEGALGMTYAHLDELLSQMLDEGIPCESLSSEAEGIWKRYQANAFKRELEPPFADVQAAQVRS